MDHLLLLADESGAAWPGPEGGAVGGEMAWLRAAKEATFLEGPSQDLSWGLQIVWATSSSAANLALPVCVRGWWRNCECPAVLAGSRAAGPGPVGKEPTSRHRIRTPKPHTGKVTLVLSTPDPDLKEFRSPVSVDNMIGCKAIQDIEKK